MDIICYSFTPAAALLVKDTSEQAVSTDIKYSSHRSAGHSDRDAALYIHYQDAIEIITVVIIIIIVVVISAPELTRK